MLVRHVGNTGGGCVRCTWVLPVLADVAGELGALELLHRAVREQQTGGPLEAKCSNRLEIYLDTRRLVPPQLNL